MSVDQGELRPATSTGPAKRSIRNESLEQTIERVIRDARQVGAQVTPRTLALAAGAMGWTHKSQPLTRSGDNRKDEQP